MEGKWQQLVNRCVQPVCVVVEWHDNSVNGREMSASSYENLAAATSESV
jgi:hypothetical protein